MPWRVWARISGPRLPSTSTRIGGAIVGPPTIAYRPPGLTVVDSSTAESSNYSVASGPTMRVVSDCWIVVEGVQADTSWGALASVEANEIPRIVTALSVGIDENAYRVEMVGADDGAEGFGNSNVIGTVSYQTVELAPYEIEIVRSRTTQMLGHKDLNVAAKVFYRGIRHADSLAGPPAIAASVLAFYQVLEACSRLVAWSPPADHNDQRIALLDSLRAELAAKRAVKDQVASVEKANTALRRLDAHFIGLRIEHTATELGLDSHWIERQRGLAKFRNSRLGHAGELPAAVDLAEWSRLDSAAPLSAYGLASTMLAAALGSMGS